MIPATGLGQIFWYTLEPWKAGPRTANPLAAGTCRAAFRPGLVCALRPDGGFLF
jgi:hypothetical protein